MTRALSGSRIVSLARDERASVVVLLVAGAAVGVALRLWVLLSNSGTLDGDEAVWGLMARHFQHGHLTAFFWGQSYGGTQETLLTVPVFWLFGASTIALRVVPIALWAIAAVLVWRLARQLLGEPRAATAGVLFWTGSAFFVWKSTRAHGFYGFGLVCELVVALLAVRLRERDSRLDYGLLGLFAGLGWWATPQSAILILPAVIWLLAMRRRALRGLPCALPAFVLGSLPWWSFNIRHDWASLRPSADATSKPAHLHNLFSTTLPTSLGLRVPWSLEWLPDAVVGGAIYVLLLLGFLYLLLRRPRGIDLFLIAALAYPVLYTLSSYTWLNTEPRYESLLLPVLASLAGYAASTPARGAVVVAVAIAFAVAGLERIDSRHLSAETADGVHVPANTQPLLHVLRSAGVKTAYANYWIAFPIVFESREQIVVATVDDLSHQRYRVTGGRVVPILGTSAGSEGRNPTYSREVGDSRNAAHIFVSGAHGESSVRALFRRNGYRLEQVGGFDVFFAPTS